MIKIKRGSVFDEKCDLIILPCSSRASVTSWVRGEILQNQLPFPSSEIPFGDIRFHSTEAKYLKADYVGYAASVNSENNRSTSTAIESIAKTLVKYCKENDCSIVNIPLLGTGAGSLDATVVLNIYKSCLNDEKIIFNVFCPDRKMFQQLTDWESTNPINSSNIEHPRVFISYSWKDEQLKKWVYELSQKLCSNGIDARLDRFHLKPGMDVPQWMTNEIIKAHKVLLVCDSHYAEKSDMRKAGVGWETMIIQGDMLQQGEMNTKYIVIAYGDFERNIPIYMKSKLGISKEDIDNNINNLLEHLFDIDTAPEIGEIPDWIKEKLIKNITKN